MRLHFKIGTLPAQWYFVCRKRKAPIVGEKLQLVAKDIPGSKPFDVRVTDIKTHTGAGLIYFVERF